MDRVSSFMKALEEGFFGKQSFTFVTLGRPIIDNVPPTLQYPKTEEGAFHEFYGKFITPNKETPTVRMSLSDHQFYGVVPNHVCRYDNGRISVLGTYRGVDELAKKYGYKVVKFNPKEK